MSKRRTTLVLPALIGALLLAPAGSARAQVPLAPGSGRALSGNASRSAAAGPSRQEGAPFQEVELDALRAEIDARVEEITHQVVAWRRDFHQHPELGNREFRTAGIIADHLRSLGMEVRTEVAHTGVVGVLRGGLPGPVVALRADMDALPVREMVDLPFASRETTDYNGQRVGVMHACGHDNHMAILMGVAEVLAGMRDRLPGSVKFIFQPAEEGAPEGESGGPTSWFGRELWRTLGPTPSSGST